MPDSRIPAKYRATVVTRAQRCCEYCFAQKRFSPDPFSIEHIYPLGLGGTHDLTNLAYSCQGCNGRKYTSVEALDPVTGVMVGLYNPRRDQWIDHFVWSDDYTLILGITAIGRATIDKLQLNREGLVNLRSILAEFGLHPPISTANEH